VLMLHTSVILLFLMIIAQFSLTLGSHSTFCLLHLFCFGLSTLVSLVGVEALHMSCGS
jgi:hypothetical protein